jgi:hypothetical protein
MVFIWKRAPNVYARRISTVPCTAQKTSTHACRPLYHTLRGWLCSYGSSKTLIAHLRKRAQPDPHRIHHQSGDRTGTGYQNWTSFDTHGGLYSHGALALLRVARPTLLISSKSASLSSKSSKLD